MSVDEPPPDAPQTEGRLFGAARRLLSTAVALVQTRVELVTTELQEEIQRAAALLLWGLAALFCAALAVLMLVVTLLIAFWDGPRLLVAGLICAAFVAVALAAGLRARSLLRSRPGLFPASRAELQRDREALERPP